MIDYLKRCTFEEPWSEPTPWGSLDSEIMANAKCWLRRDRLLLRRTSNTQMSPSWLQMKGLRRSGTNPPLRSCRASRGSSRRTRTLGSGLPPAAAPHMPQEQVAWTKWSIATLWHSDKKRPKKWHTEKPPDSSNAWYIHKISMNLV